MSKLQYNFNKILKLQNVLIGKVNLEDEHIAFQMNQLGFPSPIVDENCINCGQCLELCIYNPDNED